MTYELWSIRSRNLVASFGDEGAALAFVRAALDERGVDYVAKLALAREGADGRSETIAMGQSLVELAQDHERGLGAETAGVGRPA